MLVSTVKTRLVGIYSSKLCFKYAFLDKVVTSYLKLSSIHQHADLFFIFLQLMDSKISNTSFDH